MRRIWKGRRGEENDGRGRRVEIMSFTACMLLSVASILFHIFRILVQTVFYFPAHIAAQHGDIHIQLLGQSRHSHNKDLQIKETAGYKDTGGAGVE